MIKNLKYSVLAFAMALTLPSCSSSDSSKSGNVDSVKSEVVATKKLQSEDIVRVLTFSAVLEPYEKVSIAPALQGRIVNINAEVGDHVQKGQLLAKMDEAQYIQAKVNFENKKVDYNRIKVLNDSNNISKQTFDQTKAGIEVLESQLKNLETNTYLRAPFAGVISAKNYEPGELFGGQAIFELVQIYNLKALIEIPETYFPLIKQGMKLNINSETYPGETFPATIEIVYPTIDSKSHTFSCKIKIPNAKGTLRPGMYVNTTLEMGHDRAIIAPYGAVQKQQGAEERFVFLNENGKAKRVVVKFGQRFDDNIEIIAPEIVDGVEMVIQGGQKLHEGTPIVIKQLTAE
ncbi:MAG: efflux RND transporter periplasmic adaptor subunit [Bacteroidales bacterium]|nr:efflux RND transporter periplasmic adaptor subunit [Bacteroidales bacterium]